MLRFLLLYIRIENVVTWFKAGPTTFLDICTRNYSFVYIPNTTLVLPELTRWCSYKPTLVTESLVWLHYSRDLVTLSLSSLTSRSKKPIATGTSTCLYERNLFSLLVGAFWKCLGVPALIYSAMRKNVDRTRTILSILDSASFPCLSVLNTVPLLIILWVMKRVERASLVLDKHTNLAQAVPSPGRS